MENVKTDRLRNCKREPGRVTRNERARSRTKRVREKTSETETAENSIPAAVADAYIDRARDRKETALHKGGGGEETRQSNGELEGEEGERKHQQHPGPPSSDLMPSHGHKQAHHRLIHKMPNCFHNTTAFLAKRIR